MPLTLSEDQQNEIERWLAAMGTPQQVALRCRIVLGSWRGESEAAIASELEINRKTVRLWRERFSQAGLPGLWEIAPGRGRKATYGPDRVKAVLDATLQSKPKGQTHWSCRLMACRLRFRYARLSSKASWWASVARGSRSGQPIGGVRSAVIA